MLDYLLQVFHNMIFVANISLELCLYVSMLHKFEQKTKAGTLVLKGLQVKTVSHYSQHLVHDVYIKVLEEVAGELLVNGDISE